MTLGVLLPGFEGTELPAWVAERLDRGLAGVCLFGANITDHRQLRALTDSIVAHNPNAIIALDEEGGDVTRLYHDVGSPWPGSAWLGRYDDAGLTRRVAASVAAELRAVGCNLNLAPSADVNSNAANPVIGVRSFSADPQVAARHVRAWVDGQQDGGVAVSVKHFPGHGDTEVDSHRGLPVVAVDAETIASRDLPPFEAAVDAGAWTVMTSHIVVRALDPERPATFSRVILDDVLRRRLGFTGVVVSDAIDMAGASGETGVPEAAVRALLGGCDLICIGAYNTEDEIDRIGQAVGEAVAGGRLPRARVEDAAARVAALGSRLAARRQPAGELAELWGDDSLDLGAVQSAFALSGIATRLLDEVRSASLGWQVVQLTSQANPAVGTVPWGPLAARAHATSGAGPQAKSGAGPQAEPDPGAASDGGASHVGGSARLAVRQGILVAADGVAAADVLAAAAGRPIAVVGRDNHRRPWARALIDELRAAGGPVLAVDMGWPDGSRAYADLATFGGSRLLGRALDSMLGLTAPG